MKKTGITLMVFIFISFCSLSCTSDDTNIYEKNSLNGTWYLKSYGGGFTGQFELYKKNEVIWNFDTINTTVLIKSKRSSYGPKSGNYLYEIRQSDQNERILFLNDSVQAIMGINEEELILNHGLIATFKRCLP